jgi:hypothetical protein
MPSLSDRPSSRQASTARRHDFRTAVSATTGSYPPEILLPGANESQDVKCLALGHADRSVPHSLINFSARYEIVHYFLSVCETILRILGAQPTRAAIAGTVNRLALIFQRLQNPPSRSVNGLFGELFLIRQSRHPVRVLGAWRIQDNSRFDFSAGDIRLDVKTTNGRIRVHSFSYEQCNPPPGTIAVAASLFTERIAGGVSLRELVLEVERLAESNTELVMKLHGIVAGTLGNALPESLSIRFDQRLAAASLQFYDLKAIPAIRGDLPAGVGDVRFWSDLSSAAAIPIWVLLARERGIADFLSDPQQREHAQ